MGDCDPSHKQAAADLDMITEAGMGERVGSVDRGLVNIRLTRAYEVPHDIQVPLDACDDEGGKPACRRFRYVSVRFFDEKS